VTGVNDDGYARATLLNLTRDKLEYEPVLVTLEELPRECMSTSIFLTQAAVEEPMTQKERNVKLKSLLRLDHLNSVEGIAMQSLCLKLRYFLSGG